MSIIDLRSDTVTQPTPAMREAINRAEVGDDVYGEDPTINQLEAEAAEVLGKEAALLVTSGTQGNLTGILTHCGRGDEMILARNSHIVKYEIASAAAYGGVQPMVVDVQHDGTMDLEEIRLTMRPHHPLFPSTRLLCLENTQAVAHGAPLTPDYTAQVAELAHEHGASLHIDGARLFNAAAALDIPAKNLVANADSVSVCLSKGLCAPVGSILLGTKDFIQRARRIRKSLGGGMRQAGFIAAAGLIALHEMPKRLHEDHANARLFAEGIADLPGIRLDLSSVRTNMVFFDLTADSPMDTGEFSQRLREQYNVIIRPYEPRTGTLRAVMHHDVNREQVEQAVLAVRTVMLESAAAHA